MHTQGEGLEQARVMVREAIESVLEDRRERGEPIPAMGARRPSRSLREHDLERHLTEHG